MRTNAAILKYVKTLLVIVGASGLLGCSNESELYCTATQPCTAGHAVCDVEGICPESGGVGNTCIPQACWDAGAGAPDAGTDASQIDAGVVDAGAVDAAVSDGGPPPLTNAWGPPVRVAELSSDDYYEYKPSIRGDGLEAFFYRPGIGAMSIFYSSRTSTANPWSTPVPTIGNHGTPELSANGLELYYVSSGPTIYRRVRASTSSSFDVAVGLYSGEAPTITGDGRYLYYKNNSGEFVMRSRFSASGTFGAEQLVLLPGAPDYANLSMSRDHLVVVLAGNNQVGDPTQVEFVRETVQSPWQGPFEILELTSRGGGNCHLVSGWDMYCAMINDANGTADIYRLQRTGP